jgi:uncharacterized protein YcgL (UPF0745 family)
MNVLEQLLKAIDDEKKLVAKSLAEMPAEDYAKYMKQVGFYFGLHKSEELLIEIAKNDDLREL